MKNTLTVLQYSPSGELIKQWDNVSSASKNEYNKSSIKSCCLGNMSWYKESIWLYKKDENLLNERIKKLKKSKNKIIPVYQYDMNERLVKEWSSVSAIKEFPRYGITKCLKEKTYVYKNYIWKYKYPELAYAS